MSKIIELKNISKIYNRGSETVHAVKDITFTLNKGDYVSVMGPSGSGKTTLLNIMGCLDKPSNGSIFINDTETSDLQERDLVNIRKENIGFVFQQFFLIPTLTVKQNVQLPVLFAKKKIDDKKARELLELVGLGKRMEHLPSQLSGGEMQRVAIARSLINDPPILLADEPTGNLDTKNANNIMSLFERLNSKGLTVIIVTHNPELVKHCTKVVHIEDGQIKN
ncbi:ABC transporter ATP-binding protein [Chitinispirillales bacterium ANBcel5]|uniref:ABC transporter ATP-binding protein n=1 Tax=Cellulosispirillum alkaliphilum TaxID=3039283 RepID=UPI002A4F20CA|nr:ABC transporter ATP-binding protein [Chitinispirillales bacterium ANBcel5]